MVKQRQRKLLYNDKVSIHQENITIVNIYAPNIRVLKYIKEILTDLKREIENKTVKVGENNIQ